MNARRWLGLCYLSVLPTLAVFGVLETTESTVSRSAAVQLLVRHPERTLALAPHRIEVVVTAITDCKPLILRFDPNFMTQVDELLVLPTGSSADRFETALHAREEYRVRLEFRAQQAGRLHGAVHARCAEQPGVSAGFDMMVLP